MTMDLRLEMMVQGIHVLRDITAGASCIAESLYSLSEQYEDIEKMMRAGYITKVELANIWVACLEAATNADYNTIVHVMYDNEYRSSVVLSAENAEYMNKFIEETIGERGLGTARGDQKMDSRPYEQGV